MNIIVAAITLLLATFIGVWYCWPSYRPWIEAPKHQPLKWDQ